MNCDRCGATAPQGSEKCPYCGTYLPQHAAPSAPPPQPVVVHVHNTVQTPPAPDPNGPLKRRWVAFWLCFFFGGIGIHKFYLGKTGMGILYLFTGGLLGIGWLIDLISLLFGNARDRWGRRLA